MSEGKRRLSSYFKKVTRDSGESFYTLTDDRPDYLDDAVQAAHSHGKDLPNDWIYGECASACYAIDDEIFNVKYPEDAVHEYADSQVDIYTRDVFQWAADMCHSYTYAYAEEEASDLGVDVKEGTVKVLQMIQYCAIRTIVQTILDAWREAEEEADEDNEETVLTKEQEEVEEE